MFNYLYFWALCVFGLGFSVQDNAAEEAIHTIIVEGLSAWGNISHIVQLTITGK